jgi:DNA repair exonuclease SbcCD ATPase subunit
MSEPTAPAAPLVVDPSAEAAPTFDSFINEIDTALDSLSAEPTAPEPAKPEAPEPEPTEPAEPTEPKDDDSLDQIDEIDDTKGWTPQAAKRFKALKSELKTFKERTQTFETQIQQREQRIKELEALTDGESESAKILEKLQSYEAEMALVRLEKTSAYQEAVNKPMADIVSQSDALAEKHGLHADDLLDALSLADEAAQEERLTELMANMPDRDRFKVYQLAEKLKPILERREMLHQRSQEALAEAQELELAQERQRLAERATARKEAAQAVSDKLASKLTFLSGFEGLDLKALAGKAADVEPGTLDPVTATYHAISASLLPRMAAEYLVLQREVDNLTERLAEFDAATPRASRGAAGVTKAGERHSSSGSFVDEVDAALRGAGV